LYDQLTQQVVSKKKEAKALWTELLELWNELDNNEEVGLCFTNAEVGVLTSVSEVKQSVVSRSCGTRKLAANST